MKTYLLFLASCMMFLALPNHAHAQSSESQLGCIDTDRDSQGNAVLTNHCPYQIHVYWVLYSKPNTSYNFYLSGDGGSDTAYGTANEGYKSYACAAGYYVVDSDNHVITHLVSSFRCRKS